MVTKQKIQIMTKKTQFVTKLKNSNHIMNHHKEFYCENCCNYFPESEKFKDHKKSCIKCDRCYEKFKTLKDFCKHNKKCVLKQLEKKNRPEYSVKSDSKENSN